MKRSSLIERLANEHFECHYRKNGVDYDYDGCLLNLLLIAENPTTKIHDITMPGEDMLTIELIAQSPRTVITLRFLS